MAMRDEFAFRKQMVLNMLSEIPGIRLSEPDGAFYVFPDISSYFGKTAGDRQIANADDLAMYLLEKAHVSTVTGAAFGEPNCLRISFAASRADLRKGFGRIKNALAALQ
jgi:aspartate aminotransferase